MRLAKRLRRTCSILLFAPLVLVACQPQPEPVHIDSDACAQCSMLISERRFAAQLLNTRGRAFKFDSIECLTAFVRSGAVAAADVHSLWVTDAATAGDWLPADSAVYVRSSALRTPMGGGLIAYASPDDAQAALAQLGAGAVLDWDALKAETGAQHNSGGHDGP